MQVLISLSIYCYNLLTWSSKTKLSILQFKYTFMRKRGRVLFTKLCRSSYCKNAFNTLWKHFRRVKLRYMLYRDKNWLDVQGMSYNTHTKKWFYNQFLKDYFSSPSMIKCRVLFLRRVECISTIYFAICCKTVKRKHARFLQRSVLHKTQFSSSLYPHFPI